MNDLEQYHQQQKAWSKITFGTGRRTKGVLEHIAKELKEIEENPLDTSEWIDVIILAMEGYWRHGGENIMRDLEAKQQKNFARKWGINLDEDRAIEHIRGEE